MKASGSLSLCILAASLLAHLGLLSILGIACTKDFVTTYDSMAAQMSAWLGGMGNFPEIEHAHEWFHVNYMFFVSAVYLVFGTGNREALVVLQIILSSGASLCMFRFLARHYDSTAVAVLTTLAGFLFFDSMFMTIAASPESLYRSIFLPAFLGLIHFHHRMRHGSFLAVAVVAFAVLLGVRIDTLVLFAPVYTLGLKALCDRKGFRSPSLPVISAAILVLFLVVSLGTKLFSPEHPIYRFDHDYYVKGIVVADLGPEGTIDALAPGVRLSAVESLTRGLWLFLLRVYQFLNIVPPSWSTAHKAYYALHIVPLYLLALVGIARAWRIRDFFFGQIIYFYAASIVLHGLTRVDAAHRTNFISIIFLMMLAGYGFDFLYGIFRKRWRADHSRAAAQQAQGGSTVADMPALRS